LNRASHSSEEPAARTREDPPVAQRGITGDLPCEVGGGCVSQGGILGALAIAVAATILLIYGLVAMWPESSAAGQATPTQPQSSIAFLGWHFNLSSDARLFVIVAIAGGLGGMVHTVRSLGWYVGNRELKWSWVPFYVLLPIIGGSLATVFYLVLRAGLFSTSTPTTDANVYGFAALAALVGVFSEQALEKLREVFSSILTKAPEGRDAAPAPGGAPVAVTGEARVVSTTEAVLTGAVRPNGLETKVQFAYGQTNAYGQVVAVPTIEAAKKEVALEANVTGLTGGTTYHFRIEARSTAGESLGEDATFTTQT
jgi:hypothetical protein